MTNRSLAEQFKAVYERQADAIFRFCLWRVSERETALDLTQDTFARFWQTLSEGKVRGNEVALLFTIARNLIIDWYRRKKNLSLEALVEPFDDETTPDNSPLLADPESALIELRAEGRLLIEKIALLETSYRQVVYLRFVEDLQPREIAEILGESPGVISVRLHRGLHKLKELGGYEEK